VVQKTVDRYPGHHALAPGKSQTDSVEADNAELRHDLARLGHRSRCSAQPFVLVVATFRDKDAGALLAPLLPLASRVLCATADHPRALPAALLAEAARSLGAEAETSPSVAAALERAHALAGSRGRVLVTGSLRTVGEAMMELGMDGA
jgi:folylpolyglutamate synthase/dihydropteroate synthase